MKAFIRFCFWLGPLLLAITWLTDPPTSQLSTEAWRAIGLTLLMAIWWMTECVPIPVTALIPLVVGPLMGVGEMGRISVAFGNPLIFLFLGGFLLSIGMERTGLHLRIARQTMRLVGGKARAQVAGIMGVTAFLSMWMSNTATAIMMLPIALSVVTMHQKAGRDTTEFAPALLLGVAYGSSIGGMATLIGTPPNAFMAAYLLSSYDIQIGFMEWMLFATPLCLFFLVIAWFWMCRGIREKAPSKEGALAFCGEEGTLRKPLSRGEWGVLVVFALAVIGWVFRVPLVERTGLALSDAGIALAAGLSLFFLPFGTDSKERILEWSHTSKMPWGVLLLFGGGLALASIIQASELDFAIGQFFAGMHGVSRIVLLSTIVIGVLALTEVTSNTATAATLLPLLTPVAVALGGSPVHFAIPIALAASSAFMLPVATPPNAIVFGSGEVPMRQFIRHGFALNIMAGILLILSATFIVPLMF